MNLTRELVALYGEFGPWRRFYTRFRIVLSHLDQVESYLPRVGRVIDVGCGYGVHANYLALAAPSRSVIGIDLNATRIAEAQRTIFDRRNISFVVADALNAILPECDGAFLSDFLHHLPSRAQENLLTRLYQLLSVGGTLVIQEVNTELSWKYWFSYLADLIMYPFEEKLHNRSPENWIRVLEMVGFRDIVVLPGDAGTIFARVTYVAHK